MAASLRAASSTSARQNEPDTSFSGVPIIPESVYPRNATRSTPRILAASSSSCTRRCHSASPGSSTSSANSPCSPLVALTSTTRWPAAAAVASVPPVAMASSSGWAWKLTRVAMGSGDGPGLTELRHLLGREAPVQQRLVGVLAHVGGRAVDRTGSPAEAGGGRRLGDASHLHEGLAVNGVRVLWGLARGQHGGVAGVGALHPPAPHVAGLGPVASSRTVGQW